MRKSTLLVSTLCLAAVGCGNAPSVTSPAPFSTKQVLNTACAAPVASVNTLPLAYNNLWYQSLPYYTSSLILPSVGLGGFGYPYGGYFGGLGYGGFGYGGYGYGGGFGRNHGRIGGVAEQNDVAFRPVGSKIWQPK